MLNSQPPRCGSWLLKKSQSSGCDSGAEGRHSAVYFLRGTSINLRPLKPYLRLRRIASAARAIKLSVAVAGSGMLTTPCRYTVPVVLS